MKQDNSNKYKKENYLKFFTLSWWALKEIFRLSPFYAVLTIVATSLKGLFPILFAFYTAKGLDLLIQFVNEGRKFEELLNLSNPYTQVLLIISLLGVINSIIVEIDRYAKNTFRVKYLKQYELELNVKISNLDMEKFEDPKNAELLMKSQNAIWTVKDYFMTLLETLTELASLIGTTIILWRYNYLIVVYLVLLSLPSVQQSLYFAKTFFAFYEGNSDKYMRRGELKWYLTKQFFVIQSRVMNASEYLKNLYKKINDFLIGQELKLERDARVSNVALAILQNINNLVVALFFLYELLNKGLGIGSYTFYTGRAITLTSSLEMLTEKFSNLFSISLEMEHVKKAFDLKNEIISGELKTNISNPFKIEFKNVSFKYLGSKRYALKNVNLVINPNEEIAIVGENGAGKTTLMKLLLRLYDVTEGEILIDGVNIKELDLNHYYKAFGILLQDYRLIDSLTIAENIALGADKPFSLQDVKTATKLSDADQFVSKLKNNYSSPLGKNFENGVQLSKGQEQKVAIARMFYRNSPTLILDEPTASIDPVSEYNIFNNIYKHTENKNVIIISHRFSTVRNAQKIYVFDKGQIIEQGSHSELMKLNGVYADAFNKQAEGYTKED